MTKLKSKSKQSKTLKNNTVDELATILKEAENITLDSLDFNKTFKEQGAILCDIKYLLSKNNKNNRNGNNKPFACNPVISNKLNDSKFNALYQQFKKQNNLLNNKHVIPSRIKNSKILSKNISKKLKTRISKVKSKRSSRGSRRSSKESSSKTKYKLNTRYPIVIIKKQTPRKNVIYLNK